LPLPILDAVKQVQAMPAFFGHERSVLFGHRASFIPENIWSSGVAAFVSNAEARRRSPLRAPPQRNLGRGRLRLWQMGHAIFFTIARDTKIQIRIGLLGGAADCTAMQRVIWTARMLFKASSPC
jgi:hypothetical protein